MGNDRYALYAVLTVSMHKEETDAEALYRIKTDPQVTEFCPDFLDVDVKLEDIDGYIYNFRRIEDKGLNV